jgi:hypothetical protein
VNRLFRTVLLLPLVLLAACATETSSRAPGADFSHFRTFYVARLPADHRGIQQLISARLQQLGYRSTWGDSQTPPSPTDAIVTYQDRWMWDITMYMIRLDVQVRDGKTGAILAYGEVVRPSLQRKSPRGMVEQTLGEIFHE